MSHHHNARRILTPGASRKRKETDSAFHSAYKPPAALSAAYPAPSSSELDSSNWLLAGYMAHEFLTNGTLFGQRFDPDRTEAVPRCGGRDGGLACEQRRSKQEAEPGTKKAHRSYAEVASVLKTDGTHVPGVVNPTQLGRWILM